MKDKTCGGQHHGIEINLLNGNCYSIEVGTSENRGVWEEMSGYLAPPVSVTPDKARWGPFSIPLQTLESQPVMPRNLHDQFRVVLDCK